MCKKQKSSNQYGFVREIKLSKKLSLEGNMHIYEYGMRHLPVTTNNIKLGDCNDLFTPYYNYKLGFSSLLGMYVLVLRYNASHFIKYLFQPQKLKKEIVCWLVKGDLHTNIINMIYNHPHKDKFEEALRKLEFIIIGNSIRSGIKDDSFWNADYIMKKLIISNQELNDFLISIPSPAKNDQKDPESQNLVLVHSDENMEQNALSQHVETENFNEKSRGNDTFYTNNETINNYNNFQFNFFQVNNYNQIVFIKTEYKIPEDNFHAEQPNETHSPLRQSEPCPPKDDVPSETQIKTNNTEKQSRDESIEETTDSQQWEGELRKQPTEAINVPKKPLTKSYKGRKPALRNLEEISILGLIKKTVDPHLNVDTSLLTTKILSILMNYQDDKTKATIIVALEVCKIIEPLKDGKVKGFCELLCKECENLVKYKSFLYQYNKYEPLRKKAEEPSQNTIRNDKLDDILKWKKVFNEMLENTKKC